MKQTHLRIHRPITTTIDRGYIVTSTAEYFAEIAKVFLQAKQAIYICGWDFHSQIELTKNDPPIILYELLIEALTKNPDLHIYILIWKSNVFYQYDREKMPTISLDWLSHERIHFTLYDKYPMSASLHQKIVCIDDTIAYCGGMDLTTKRWDTIDNLPDDTRRSTPYKETYKPFYDTILRLQGDAAKELGTIFRNRWKEQTSNVLQKINQNKQNNFNNLPWFYGAMEARVTQTMPTYKDRKRVRACEKEIIHLLHQAKEHIYIENQYFTSKKLKRHLAKRLKKSNGPYITIIVPGTNSSGLGNKILTINRNVLFWKLKKKDAQNKLGIFYPTSGQGTAEIFVHSKCMIIDDTNVCIGSCNFNDRSMGLDLECNITLDAQNDAETCQKINEQKLLLLSLHSGLPINTLAHTPIEDLHNTIMHNKESQKKLLAIAITKPPKWQRVLAAYNLADYSHPLIIDSLLDIIHKSLEWTRSKKITQYTKHKKMLIFLLFILPISFASAIGAYNGEGVNNIITTLESLQNISYIGMYILILFIIGELLCIPITFLFLVTATILPLSYSYAVIGAGTLFSALCNYYCGRLIGLTRFKAIVPTVYSTVGTKLTKGNASTVSMVRLLPIMSFSVTSYMAGAVKVAIRPYVFGTLAGILPSVIVLPLIQKNLLFILKEPTLLGVVMIVGYILLLLMGIDFFMKRVIE